MRCKVYCSWKQVNDSGVMLAFSPVIEGSEENKQFFKYTPGANIQIYTVNTDIGDKFELGKEYYLDFSSAN